MTTETVAPSTDERGWKADDGTFGARLALVRQRMAWGSVAEAAKACGLPVESWRTWERDGVEPRRIVTIALAIATRTGCDPNWLLGIDRVSSTNTRGYSQSRLVAVVGARPTERPPVHSGRPDRSVRQTQPLSGVARRPAALLAV